MSSTSSSMRATCVNIIAVLGLSFGLGGCDYIGSFGKPKQTPEEARAEGIALGAGCRQAGQTLEDCFQRNPESQKAGMFTGWKEMHEYMAAKNIQTAMPTPVKDEAEADAATKEGGKDDKSARKDKDKDGSKDKDSRESRNRDRDSSKDKDKDSSRSARNRDKDSSKDKDSAGSDRNSKSASRDDAPRKDRY